MASVEIDRHSKSYHVRFRFGGASYKRSLKTADKGTAEAALARVEELVRLLEAGRVQMPEGADPGVWIVSDGKVERKAAPEKKETRPEERKVVTLKDLFDVYVENTPPGHHEENSAETEELHRSHLLRILGGSAEVATMRACDLQRYVSKRAKEDYRGKTIRSRTIKKEVATLRAVWNRTVQLGLIAGAAPTKGLQYPKEPAKPPFQTREEIEAAIARGGLSQEEIDDLWDSLFLTVAEVKEVLELVRGRARFPFIHPMFCFVAYTGARRSEMRRSLVHDILFDQGKVRLREKKKDRSKVVTYRHVEVRPEFMEMMRGWFDASHPGGPITICQPLATRGKRRQDFVPLTTNESNHHFQRTLAGTKWSVIRGFHVFRHSFASNLARAGVSGDVIDEFMGHQTEEMRRRYRHLHPDQRKKAVAFLYA